MRYRWYKVELATHPPVVLEEEMELVRSVHVKYLAWVVSMYTIVILVSN